LKTKARREFEECSSSKPVQQTVSVLKLEELENEGEKESEIHTLYPLRPRIHGYQMTNLIDRIVIKIIQMVPIFRSPESVKNITCTPKHHMNCASNLYWRVSVSKLEEIENQWVKESLKSADITPER